MRYVNVKENNQICSPLKTSQSVNVLMLNKAHVIEITKACSVLFMKARSSLAVRCRERQKKKKNTHKKTPKDNENVFFKALTNRFYLTSKSCSWFSKFVYGKPSIKLTSWKGIDMLLKVNKMFSLLRKSPWKWSLASKWSKLLLTAFTFNFPFICYLGRICK